MPQIEEEVTIKASAEKIYALLAKTTNLAKLVPQIRVKVIEKGDDYQITEWKLATKKQVFTWRQRENYDPEMLRIDYSLLKGDWQSYVARWQINPAGDECDLILQIEVNPKQQGLKSYIAWPFFWKQLRDFSQEAIQAVKDRLELSYGQSA